MPRRAEIIKAKNVKILQSKVDAFGTDVLSELDDYCTDADNFLIKIGAEDNEILDEERELITSMFTDIRADMLKMMKTKLMMKLKRDESLLSALVHSITKQEPEETTEKQQRDKEIQRQLELKTQINKNPIARTLEKNIVPDESSNICLHFLITHLLGEDWKIEKMREYRSPRLGGHIPKDVVDESNTRQWFLQYNKVQISVQKALRLMGLKLESCKTPGSYWDYDQEKHIPYTTHVIHGYKYKSSIDLSWDTTIC